MLCTGYMGDMIRKEFGADYRNMELVYSHEDSPLGTGGALRNALGLLSGDMLLILNGDSFCRCNIGNFINSQVASGTSAGIVLAYVEDLSRFGAVLTNDNSHVVSFVEKGVQSGSGWINAGIYLIPLKMIQEFSPNRQVSLERELVPMLIAQGLYGYYCMGSFIDIGVPEEYQRAQSFFPDQMKGKP